MNIQSPVKIWRTQKKIIKNLGKRGVIKSFTIIHVPPLGFEAQAPYPVVLVSLTGKTMVGQLVDYEQHHLKIDQKIEAVLRRIKEPSSEGVIPYGIKFRPIA